ncbi:MAG TPA: metallophosphoesterase [Thermoanaerobaculia bacterium]|nr:metallophosphoesterase [Thermoanaerobaculia bacterium]
MIRRLVFLLLAASAAGAETNVTLLHFSDYHSHALPFYTEEGERGGIARAVAYLKREKRRGALVFSGGDTVNKGAPAWSDKYGCAEWPWWNGVVDAMAFGNHDADYGRTAFDQCRKAVRYPILSANTPGFERYEVFVVNGIRIGVFAVAGSDFPSLVQAEGLTFTDPLAAAREVVQQLREKERVQAVVMIGHQHLEADYDLARAVPGIDLIFGSHSHVKRALTRIDGTRTWFISPWQYLGYVSRVQLTFAGGRLTKAIGDLVPIDAHMPEEPAIARRVQTMQAALERDPVYRELFVPIGTLAAPLSVETLAQRTLEIMRTVAGADVVLSTKSSFRRALPAGTLTMELLRAALPYDNEIVVCAMTGGQLQRVLGAAAAESFVSGADSIDPARTYRVATTDYVAFVAYEEVFTCEKQKTGSRVRDELRKTF